ncbi:mycofactocin biosynthesis glycosyltransferase MftF [Streptomyces sp. NPDC051572]|uniref:mycofactocin biosynthesis glycosyltransferase MftF n=1 Tax=unclassified Streptomyces TaxID=2593676 RepID=UPI00344F1B41
MKEPEASTTAPLPAGFRIAIDAGTKQLDEVTLFGGSPARVIRLSATGRTAWAELHDGVVSSAAAGVLARRLTDDGLAHPRPPVLAAAPDVTVIIPVRDRPEMLARCLASLGRAHPVLVVDDGSADPCAVAETAARYGATLLRRPDSGGPGAARDTGLAHVSSDLVAFVDSDCVVPDSWIEQLAAHFADPLVAAVAPRIVALQSMTTAGRYSAVCGSLDLGGSEGRVVPGTRVAYVPTAALVARRDALLKVARYGDVFDPGLRYGEDVDLVWRLHEADWRIRYDPAVEVCHHEPETWPALLGRRFRYGTSAAPLAVRHPKAMAPLVLQPWPTLTVAALLARRPASAAAGFTVSVLAMNRTLRQGGLPPTGVPGAMLTGVHQTWLGIGRYATQFAAPLLAVALAAPGGSTPVQRWGRRAAAASLLLGPPMAAWQARRPTLDPGRFSLGHIADDLAYGAGVWASCLRARTTKPIRPAVSWRPFRVAPRPAATPTTTPC